MDVQVAAYERGQPGDVLVEDLVAKGTKAPEGGVHVQGVPEHHAVED